MSKLRLPILASFVAIALATPIRAELIYAVNGNNELLVFDDSAPTLILSRTAITNTGGNAILNIDVRPGTGQLYGLSSNNDLYVLNAATGAASFVGATGAVINSGFDYGFDFNPVPDRIRVATDAGGNFRVNPMNGAVTTDGNLFYIAGDANAGQTPTIVGAAYTNNFGPSPRTPPPGTQLFYIDSGLDILAFSSAPNTGNLATVGALGLDVTGLLGFDISGLSGFAFAALSTNAFNSGFYRIDLTTGAATFINAIGLGAGETILDISAVSVPDHGSTALLFAISAVALVYFRQRISRTA